MLLLREKTYRDSGMKQCPNCGDIALEEYAKGHWICGTCGWEVFEDKKTLKTNNPKSFLFVYVRYSYSMKT